MRTAFHRPSYRGLLACLLPAAAMVAAGCGATRDWAGNGPPPGDAFVEASEAAEEPQSACTDPGGEGCPCSGDPPKECYEGPAGTAGVGICRAGVRTCLGSTWGACEGQVLPAAAEWCNGIDDDCSGEIDDGAVGECGTCDPHCHIDAIGRDAETPWDPTAENSDSVSVNDEGGLVLDVDTAGLEPIIWVANTGQGSVSKIDTRTFAELGRYRTGNDPSRTSVNVFGDVYVGNRNGQSVTKVSVLGDGCPDTNGDTLITTSHGGDLLGLGQDDCVLWTTSLAGHGVVRAVAAQDLFHPVTGVGQHYVWAGSWEGRKLWKLDGMTGNVLVGPVALPARPYGFAMDGRGNLWVMGREPNLLVRVDTTRCIDDAACSAAPCGDEGDDCVIQSVTMPIQGYGITVDFKQRVWVGRGVARYDPFRPPGERWTVVGVPIRTHGVAADAEGRVWAAAWNPETGGKGVYRIDADNPADYVLVPGSSVASPKGIAVDSDGKIWVINRNHDNATVIVPGPAMLDAEILTNVSPVFSSPYTYSDMTGVQQRLAMAPRGFYRALLAGCEEGDMRWLDLGFDVTVPVHAEVIILVRTAETVESIASARPVALAQIPDDVSPVSIAAALERESVAPARFLEVELQLSSEIVDSTPPPAPVVNTLFVTHTCDPGGMPTI